jgi:hypothetical protein
MIIRLHRWQPRANRYRTQQLDLEDARPILDLIINNGTGVRVAVDPTVEQKILRTQRVDRITINSLDSTVDIFLSPIVDRVYKKQVNTRKASLSDNLCSCLHAIESHGGKDHEGICLIPGCKCQLCDPAGTRRERCDEFSKQLGKLGRSLNANTIDDLLEE